MEMQESQGMDGFEESIPLSQGRAILMTMWYRGWRIIIPFCAVISLLAGRPWGALEVRAATVYSYIDDQGNPVFTDMQETIPEKYRAKVKTHERPDADKKSSSGVAAAKEKIVEKVKGLGATMPSLKMNLKNLGSSQSDILTSAGIAALVLVCVMYFSKKSPMIRLLALGLLFVLAIGTPVLMYTSDGGAMDVMKKKAAATGQAQHDRFQQVPQ
jgi:hypothetical protein